MAENAPRARQLGLAALAGVVWGQVAIAVSLLVLPRFHVLGERVADGWAYRLAAWTLLAPLEVATLVVAGGSNAAADRPFATLVVCPLLGAVMCVMAAACSLSSLKWRRALGRTIAAAGLLGMVCGSIVGLQLHQAILAEEVFFAMVSRVEIPHKDMATVAAAREFVRRYEDSRWAGEALRIVAMAEWDAGRIDSAHRLWSRFASRFSDPSAPGVAYAEYSMALCDERLGRTLATEAHLHNAIAVIRSRGDGVQGWIAAEAAERLAALERSDGRYALAGYWNTKSRTFADVYPTE